MKIQIDIEDKVKENDILIYKDDKFVPVSKDRFLRDTNNNIRQINEQLSNLNKYTEKLENRISDLEREVKVLKGEE